MYEVSEGWNNFNAVKNWWHSVINVNDDVCKELTSFFMLTSWEIWCERNAQIFRNLFIRAGHHVW